MLKNTLNAAKTVRSCFATSKQLTNKTSSSVSPLALLFPLSLRESPENFKSQLYFKFRSTFCSGDSPNKPNGPKSESLELNNDKNLIEKSTESFYEHYSIKKVKSSEAKLLLEIITAGNGKQELIKKLPEPLLKLLHDLFDLDKGINPKYISTNLQGRITSALKNGKFIFLPTKAITHTIFQEFNRQNERLYFTGPTSVGKSCSLALLAVVLRADPNNRVFFIHNTVDFVDDPVSGMIAEILAAFESDFADPSNKEAQELKRKLISIQDQSTSMPGMEDFTISVCTTEVRKYLRDKGLTVHFILDQNDHISRMRQSNVQRAFHARNVVAKLSSIATRNNGKVVIAASANDQHAPKENDEFTAAFYLDDIIQDKEGAKFAQLIFDNKLTNSEALAVSEVARNNFGEIKLVSAQKAEKIEDKIRLYIINRTEDIRDSIESKFIKESEEVGISQENIFEAIYQIMIYKNATPLLKLIDIRYIRKHSSGEYTFLCLPAELAWKRLIFENADLITVLFNRELQNRHENPTKFGWVLETYIEYVIRRTTPDRPIKLTTDTYRDGKHAKEVVEISFNKSAYVQIKPVDEKSKSVEKPGDKPANKKGKKEKKAQSLHILSDSEEKKILLVPTRKTFPLVDYLILDRSEKKVILIQVKSVLKTDHLNEGQKYLQDAEDAKLNKAAIDECLGVEKTIFLWIYCDTDLTENQLSNYKDMNFIQLKDLPDDHFRFDRSLLSVEKQTDFTKEPKYSTSF